MNVENKAVLACEERNGASGAEQEEESEELALKKDEAPSTGECEAAASPAPSKSASSPEIVTTTDPTAPSPSAPTEYARKSVLSLTPHELGIEGERMAATYLTRRGWLVLERNWRCRFGEVDIIAKDTEANDVANTAVLVEVKTRLAVGCENQMPELAVDARKQSKYRTLALTYLAEHPDVERVRFDVIAVNVTGEGTAKLRHLVGAYDWNER